MVEKTLRRWRGKQAKDVETTIDLDVQRAAEQALGTTKKKMALVALQPSTGNVLAVANRPSADTLDRALTGLYPPGSTFKVITTTALLRDGLSVDQTVPCPKNEVVDGRSFKNFEGGAAGDGPVPHRLRAVLQHRVHLARGRASARSALTDTAKDFGIGERAQARRPGGRRQGPGGRLRRPPARR